MRNYAMFLTGITTALITVDVLIECTEMEFFHLVFATLMTGFLASCLFAMVTAPRKRKAHWEKSGGLDVMIIGRRK